MPRIMLDIVFVFTLLFSIVIVGLLVLLAIRGLKGSSDDSESDNQEHRSRAGGSVPLGLRHRATRANRGENSEDEMEFPDDNFNMDDLPKKIGVKKQRKMEMKAEKRMAREQELRDREERKKQMEERDRLRKVEEEKLEAEEKAKEEAERIEKERKEKEEYEQYLKLKESFAVEEEGYDGDANEEESQNKLQAFIDYIQNHKVVHMDELAGHFHLKTPEVIQRIQDLLAQELLIGVIDDRGKFIYITNEELQSVAKFVKQRGRVSISELAENSNSFINLVAVDN